MDNIRLLARNGATQLGSLAAETTSELTIFTPYITLDGADFLASSLQPQFLARGRLTVLTDLSPLPVCQGATDPKAIRNLMRFVTNSALFHLPKLHAKVFVSDARRAIITSANLSTGGLKANFEYGVELNDERHAAKAYQDISEFMRLAAAIEPSQLDAYIDVAEGVRDRFRIQQASAAREAKQSLSSLLQVAEDSLIRLRLKGAPITSIFEETIRYILRLEGPLTTRQIHERIEQIHSDLCDNTVDRVIDGRHYGRKWKHSVRSAQQHLKSRAVVELVDGRWRLKSGEQNDPSPISPLF